MNPGEYLRQVRAEVARVKWPKKDEVIRLSVLVIGVSVVTAAFIGGLDVLFVNLLEFLVTK